MNLKLPPDVTHLAASFLDASDLTTLNQAFPALAPLTSVTLLGDIRENGPHGGDHKKRSHPIIIPRIPQGWCLHSVTISYSWRDQGWGNRKGRFWVVARNQDRDTIDRHSEWCGGFGEGNEEVCVTPHAAPHALESGKLVFVPVPGKEYHLWHVVGGGGGHQLVVQDLQVCVAMLPEPTSNKTSSLCLQIKTQDKPGGL